MSAAPPGPAQLRTVEAGRGLAALLVVLFHAAAMIAAPKYWGVPVFGGVFGFGYAGVEFFFVLSGFIIAQVHGGDIGQPAQLRRYAARRFVRIYPVYWLVLAAMVALVTLPLGLGVPPAGAVLLPSIILAGPDATPVTNVLAVAWTLYHEIAFYLVFGLLIVSRRAGLALVAAWTLLVLTRLAGLSIAGVPPYLSSPLNLLFLFGAAASVVARRVAIPAPALVTVAAGLGFVAVGLDTLYGGHLSEPAQQLLFGLAAAVGLAAVVSFERRRAVAVPPLLLALGAASYSIYLTHFPLLSMLGKVAVRTGLRAALPAPAAFVLLVGVAVALGYGFHRLVEKPLLRWATRLVSPGTAAKSGATGKG